MDPIAALPNTQIRPGQPMSDAFLAREVTTYLHACHWVKDLPYGSNSRIDAPLIVFIEGRGTCFTKHGAIARLAGELALDVHKLAAHCLLQRQHLAGDAPAGAPREQ